MMKTRVVLLAASLLLGVPGIAFAGSPAARAGDTTTHAGVITAGSSNVRVQGVPAALFGSFVACPIPFHTGGNMVFGSTTVRVNGAPAIRTGSLIPESGSQSIVIGGATTVLIQ